MQTLSDVILYNRTMQELYNLYLRTGIIDIEREIGRRLSTCDVTTLDFIHLNKDRLENTWLKSVYVKQGIETAFSCVPWKIGVVYNYTDESYRVNNISVFLGEQSYKVNNRKFAPTWSESNRTKLTLREIVSSNSKIINNNISLRTASPELDATIRQTLINSDMVTISICLFVPATNQSYDQSLKEAKTMYPCNISSGDFSHPLIVLPPGVNLLDYNVLITKSENYLKLLDLYYLTRN